MHRFNTGAAQPGLQTQAEIGRIDADENVRGIGQEVLIDAASNAQQFRQTLEGLNETHDREAVHREQAVQTLRLHQRPADTLNL